MSFVIYREGHVTDLDLFSTFMSMDHKTRLSPRPRPTVWQTSDLVRSCETRNIKHIWNVIIVLMSLLVPS